MDLKLLLQLLPVVLFWAVLLVTGLFGLLALLIIWPRWVANFLSVFSHERLTQLIYQKRGSSR